MTASPNQGRAAVLRGSFPALAVLYVLLFGSFGAEAPFFPLFLQSRGRTAAEIGLILSAGTVVRLSFGPLVGILADRVGIRLTLGVTTIAAGCIGFGYLAASSFVALLGVSMLHATVLTSLTPLSDALALAASAREKAFAYGWVRGIGSGGFVLATLASGAVVAAFGLPSIIVVASVMILLMVAPLPWIASPERTAGGPPLAGIAALLAIPAFRRILLVGGLVIGSQSMSDTFAAIHWRAAGVSPTIVGALWAEAVAAELLVFLLIGPFLLRRFGPSRCAVLGASSGIVQWGRARLDGRSCAARAESAAARPHLRADPSVLHDCHRRHRPDRAGRHGAGALRHALPRAGLGARHDGLGRAVGHLERACLLGHVGTMPRRRAGRGDPETASRHRDRLTSPLPSAPVLS